MEQENYTFDDIDRMIDHINGVLDRAGLSRRKALGLFAEMAREEAEEKVR